MTMLERTARAMWDADSLHSAENWDAPFVPWQITEEFDRETYRRRARAVLQAMREPTPEMICAGDRTHTYERFSTNITDADAERCWQAMLDAALSEK